MDIKVKPEYTYEFGFSKKTSDNFIKMVVFILQERKQFILKINNISFKQKKAKVKPEEFKKFNDCFHDDDDYKVIMSILETKGYIEKSDDGLFNWLGVNQEQSEPSALISALITQQYLVTKNRSAIARAFLFSIKTDIPSDTIRKIFASGNILDLLKDIPERSKLR